MRVADKVAIVTGAASGLGHAIARRLAQDGATVVVADIDAAGAAAVADEIRRAQGRAEACRADVTAPAELAETTAAIAARLGRIDILVNNAGITRYRAFASMTAQDWDAVLDVDLKGVFFCTQAVAPHMIARRYGKIVNIASVAGTGTGANAAGSPGGNANYAAAKAGVIQLTKTLARELGPHNINVNCVAPGAVLTAATLTSRTPEEAERHLELRRRSTVLQRVGTPEDIAHAVLFLASDEASFIAGELLCVDGGRIDRM